MNEYSLIFYQRYRIIGSDRLGNAWLVDVETGDHAWVVSGLSPRLPCDSKHCLQAGRPMFAGRYS